VLFNYKFDYYPELRINKMKKILVLCFFSLSANAQNPKPLEQIQKEEQYQKALDALNNLDSQLQILVRKREVDCQKAVGYQPFCGCILKDLPVAWTFNEYIAITTKSKAENGYENLDKDNKKAYDLVSPIRDKCVKEINRK
jgi:hypothetical protein